MQYTLRYSGTLTVTDEMIGGYSMNRNQVLNFARLLVPDGASLEIIASANDGRDYRDSTPLMESLAQAVAQQAKDSL